MENSAIRSKLSFLFVLFVFPMAAENNKNYSPQDTVIAFDLHEVIVDFSYKKVLCAIGLFLKRDFWYKATLFNPVCVYRICSILKHTSRTAENVYDNLAISYPRLAESRNGFLAMCNAYDIDAEMLSLIRNLKAAGYRLAICSNIGRDAYLVYSAAHPELFELFDVIVTSNPEDGYMRKPAPEFFENFKKVCQEKLQQQELQIIFVDDRIKNIRASQKLGWESLHFCDAQKLSCDLENLGVHGI